MSHGSQKYFRLIQDDDGHWYVIRLSETEEFYRWLEAAPYWDGYSGPQFDERRVSGPHCIAFPEYTEQ